MPEDASSPSEDVQLNLNADGTSPADAPAETSSTSEPDTPSSSDDLTLSPLDAVEKAMESIQAEETAEKEAKSAEAKEAQPADEAAETETGQENEDQEKGTEDEKLPFHDHPRWQELVKERNTLKSDLAELQEKAQTFEQGHQMAQGFDEYLKQNRLTYDDANAAMQIAADMRNNPARVLPTLRQYVAELERLTGERLPTDLEQQVAAGRMDAATAQTVARQMGAARQEQRSIQDGHAEIQEQRAQLVKDAIGQWEASIKVNDPDYDKKSEFLTAMVSNKVRERVDAGNPINSVTEAVKIAQECYDVVTERLTGLSPKAKPREMKPVSDTTPAPTAKRQPESILDIVNAVVDGDDNLSEAV